MKTLSTYTDLPCDLAKHCGWHAYIDIRSPLNETSPSLLFLFPKWNKAEKERYKINTPDCGVQGGDKRKRWVPCTVVKSVEFVQE